VIVLGSLAMYFFRRASPNPCLPTLFPPTLLQMMTPLLFCVNRGYMEIVRQLIDMGADRNCSDKNVRTVLPGCAVIRWQINAEHSVP
jgi:hypothetical protein